MATFLHSGTRWALLATVLVAGIAVADEPAPLKLGNADKSQLVVGDYYEVTVEHGKVKTDGPGYLLKVTDDWLVLGAVICAADATEVPYLSDLPFVGEYFIHRTIKTEKYIYWVPRTAARIHSRTTFEDKSDFERFKGDEFKLEACGTIVLAKHDKMQWQSPRQGVEFRDGKLHFATERTETIWSEPKGWRGLPIVNAFTAECHQEVRRETHEVPLDEVCSLAQHIPYEIENPLQADTRRFLDR